MLDPATGPFLFDTSAESWLTRSRDPAIQTWWKNYLVRHPVHVSSITVLERMRGYALLALSAVGERRERIDAARLAYLRALGYVWPVTGSVAMLAAEIMALLPLPPTPPRRAHRLSESRAERLARWRFDAIIAATALVSDLVLIHENAADLEAIRSAIEISPNRFHGTGPLKLTRCGSLA